MDTTTVDTFFAAIQNGKVRVISQMLDSGIDVNCCSESGQTALMQAVQTRKDDVRTHIVRLLLSKGCEVNTQDQSGGTVLMLAAFEKDREDVVRRIVSTGNCDPNLQDRRGDTALIHAVYGNNPAVIRILVNTAQTKNIIDVNKRNADGINPLKVAFKLRREECCKVLVEEGRADTNVVRDQNALARMLNKDVQQLPQEIGVRGEAKRRYKKKAQKLPKEMFHQQNNNNSHPDDYDEVDVETNKAQKKRKRERLSRSTLNGNHHNELHVETLKPLALSPTAVRNVNTGDNRYEGWTPHGSSPQRDFQGYDKAYPLIPLNTSPRSPEPKHRSYVSSTRFSDQTSPTNRADQSSIFKPDGLNMATNQKLGRLAPLSMSISDPFGSTRKDSVLPAIPTNGNRVNLIASPNVQTSSHVFP